MRTPKVDEKDWYNALSRRLRRNGRFHDGIVEVGGVDFPVHCDVLVTVSSFFEAAFTGPFAEGLTRRLKIADASCAAVDAILDYAYGADIFSSDTKHFDLVLEIMELSHRFFMSDLLQRAATVVVKTVPLTKYVSTFQMMKKYDITDAEDAIFFKMAHFYNAMLEANHVVDLSNEELGQLISSPELIAEEVAIFKGVIAWAKKNIVEREQFMPELLGKIRFQRFKEKEILQVLMHKDILSKDILTSVLEQCMYSPGLSVMSTRRYFSIDHGTIMTVMSPPAWFAAYPMSYVDTVFRRMSDTRSRTCVFTIPIVLTEDFRNPEFVRSFSLNYCHVAVTVSITLVRESLRFSLVLDRRLSREMEYNGQRVNFEEVQYLEPSVHGKFLLCRTRFVSDEIDPDVQRVQVWEFDEIIAKEDDVNDEVQKAKRLRKESPHLVEFATVPLTWFGKKCTLFMWLQTASRGEFRMCDEDTPLDVKELYLGQSGRSGRRVGWHDGIRRF